MKKEARDKALKMFLKAGGKITNREIAKAVDVNALTVGRWKRVDRWDTALKRSIKATKPKKGLVIRKKAARNKAEQLFNDSGGSITNKELALRVGVSPATISKWKDLDSWDKKLAKKEPPAEKAVVAEPEKAAPPPVERLGLDMNELTSPEQIVEINRRIDYLLQREHLTTAEVRDLADAKSDLLEAVEKYVGVVRLMKEIKEQ